MGRNDERMKVLTGSEDGQEEELHQMVDSSKRAHGSMYIRPPLFRWGPLDYLRGLLQTQSGIRERAWDATNDQESVTVDVLTATQGSTRIGQMLRDALRVALTAHPFKWRADGVEVAQSTSLAPGWNVFYKSFALTAGAASDVALIAAVASLKFDVILGGILVVPVDNVAQTTITATFQDSDNVAVTGFLAALLSYVWSTTTSVFAGALSQTYPSSTARFITATANRALEVDVAGGNGTETVVIWGLYRQV